MKQQHFKNKLVVAISSRALFNLDESHAIYEEKGTKLYSEYQRENENKVLTPGMAFPLVRKLLSLKNPEDDEPLVEVILLSRNSADTGLRIFNSIQHHNLPITRATFTSGESPYQYIGAFGADLFLSAHAEDVVSALNDGHAAATILPGMLKENESEQLRIAFDGDAVIFSDEAERIYQEKGLDAFKESETAAANIPLSGGPFKGFLSALYELQTKFPSKNCPIRTALVTARDAPSHERVIRTMREWNIRIDEALFLGGLTKAEFLKAFGADIFFDDQHLHCDAAKDSVATGHVPNSISGKPSK